MVTDQDYIELKHRVIHLEGKVEFLYQHLGLTFVPESQPTDDPEVIEQLKKGKTLDAMKVYRELHGASMAEAKQAVEEIMARLAL
jgi:ribosomal protein L7/L12